MELNNLQNVNETNWVAETDEVSRESRLWPWLLLRDQRLCKIASSRLAKCLATSSPRGLVKYRRLETLDQTSRSVRREPLPPRPYLWRCVKACKAHGHPKWTWPKPFQTVLRPVALIALSNRPERSAGSQTVSNRFRKKKSQSVKS